MVLLSKHSLAGAKQQDKQRRTISDRDRLGHINRDAGSNTFFYNTYLFQFCARIYRNPE